MTNPLYDYLATKRNLSVKCTLAKYFVRIYVQSQLIADQFGGFKLVFENMNTFSLNELIYFLYYKGKKISLQERKNSFNSSAMIQLDI